MARQTAFPDFKNTQRIVEIPILKNRSVGIVGIPIRTIKQDMSQTSANNGCQYHINQQFIQNQTTIRINSGSNILQSVVRKQSSQCQGSRCRVLLLVERYLFFAIHLKGKLTSATFLEDAIAVVEAFSQFFLLFQWKIKNVYTFL